MYDLESIQLPAKLKSWRFTECDNAILEVFISEDHYSLFANKVFWEAHFKGFWADLNLDGVIHVPNAFCVWCPYENKKPAWIDGQCGPDQIHLMFRVDRRYWQLILQLNPLFRKSERKKAEA